MGQLSSLVLPAKDPRETVRWTLENELRAESSTTCTYAFVTQPEGCYLYMRLKGCKQLAMRIPPNSPSSTHYDEHFLMLWTQCQLLHLAGVNVHDESSGGRLPCVAWTYWIDSADDCEFGHLQRPLGLWYDLWCANCFRSGSNGAYVVPAYYRLLWALRCARPDEQLSDEARRELVRMHPIIRARGIPLSPHIPHMPNLVRLFGSLFSEHLCSIWSLSPLLPRDVCMAISISYMYLLVLDKRQS